MKPLYKKLSVIFVLAILISPLACPPAGHAQDSFPQVNEPIQGSGVLNTGEHLPLSSSSPASFQRNLEIALSADDTAIWSDENHNVYGDWYWICHTDAEILEIDFIGDSYSVSGNRIDFYGLDGYFKVVWRTSGGVERIGKFLSFGGYAWASQAFDFNATISFPEFYSDYIHSISPSGYTQSPGRVTWSQLGITEFTFELVFDLGIDITSALFPNGNETAHHTSQWPDFVFRRVQWLSTIVEFEGTINPETDSLRWSVKGPNQGDFRAIPIWTPSLSDTNWAVREGDLVGQSRTDEIFIPAEAAIGLYTLKVAAYRNTGEGSIFQDSESTPSFYVIFNPWNDDDDSRYDEDVYNSGFNSAELSWYGQSGTGKNYYPNGSAAVDWVLSPFEESVFFPAIDEVVGVNSARIAMQRLVDKARWNDGTPSASEVLEGRWGWSLIPYKVNWRDVPAIMSAWNNGNKHPTGQCMDFGGLVASFARAIGVPARMLTNVNSYDPHNNSIWNFHVWNEVWVNDVSSTSWSPADGTYGVGPTTRRDSFIQEEVSTSTGIYTYDARTGGKVNILSDYLTPLGANSRPAEGSTPHSALTLTVGTTRSTYDFGDPVTVLVTATNGGATSFSGVLQNSIAAVDYTGAHEFYSYPGRNVTVPAGGTVVETYSLSLSNYMWNGNFLASAELATAKADSKFEIKDGLDLLLTVSDEVAIGQSIGISLSVTNTLAAPISNLSIEVYFPPSVNGVQNPISLAIPFLAAGEAYVTSWTVSIGTPGLHSVVADVSSADAGYDQAYTSFTSLGYANLAVLVEVPENVTPGVPFNATAKVHNEGDLTATNVQAILSFSSGVSTSDPVTVSVGNLAPGQEQTIPWLLTASTAGVHTLQVNATETSVGDSELATQFVVSVQHPHSIVLTASQQIVNGLSPVTITLTLQNFGDAQDSILLDVVSGNPNTGFTVYNGNIPLEGAVTVPAHGSRTLGLVIRPRQWESGDVSVKAISELDPNAVDYLTIAVSGQPFTIFLPAVTRNFVAR